jgi:predicted AlkP superfamily pyrophosphatase or phosphodiesterase
LKIHIVCGLLAASLLAYAFTSSSHAEEPAKDSQINLVLQITVDGLRGDLIGRYGSAFGDGGFALLLRKGVVYSNAQYGHANTETIVGHTTLATGAQPADHGMIGNVWYDRDSGELAYNIEDPAHSILPTREHAATGAQVDPSQLAARTKGRSPVSILASTFSDELANHYGGRSRIFAVGGKDRSAVSMAGHGGKAFWFSTDTGDFVTSTFYYDAYPAWAKDWNARRQSEAQAGKTWDLLGDEAGYVMAGHDDRPFEVDLKGYGRVFPHAFGEVTHPLFNTRIMVSPVGDQLALDFAKALIAGEKLGTGEAPDYLSISFSSVDAVNHFFGPSSLENEDIVRQLDKTLADLFAYVDEVIGLENVLIVLSADHGMAEMPEHMAAQGMAVGRIYDDQIVAAANQAASDALGIEAAVKRFFRPYLYLDADVIEQSGLTTTAVEHAIASALTDMKGIALAVGRSALDTMQDTPLLQRIRNNSHPSRSGDIYVVQEPYWFLFGKGPIGVMHGSPWRYDTFVPIIFMGPGIAPANIYREVSPVDVAPTLSAILGVKMPSSASGTVLEEVIRQPN